MTPERLRLEDAERWLAIARSDLDAAEAFETARAALQHVERLVDKSSET